MQRIQASQVCCHNATIRCIVDEFIELLQEVVHFSWPGIKSEFWDVYTFFYVWLYHRFGINLSLLDNPSSRSWAKRYFWWKVWLGAHCLEFHSHYMIYGGNFRRRQKRHRVLEMAKQEQTRKEKKHA